MQAKGSTYRPYQYVKQPSCVKAQNMLITKTSDYKHENRHLGYLMHILYIGMPTGC